MRASFNIVPGSAVKPPMARLCAGLGVALLALVVASAGCRGPSKDQWSDKMVDKLPAELCKEGSYFVSCFEVTVDECSDNLRRLTRECLDEYRSQLPDRFDSAKGSEWGRIIGMCAGGRYDVTLAARMRRTAKCQDPSAWTQ